MLSSELLEFLTLRGGWGCFGFYCLAVSICQHMIINVVNYLILCPHFSLEASGILDVENIKHIQEDKQLIVDVVEKVANDWHAQKQAFYKQTGLGEDDEYEKELEQLLLDHHPHSGDSNQD